MAHVPGVAEKASVFGMWQTGEEVGSRVASWPVGRVTYQVGDRDQWQIRKRTGLNLLHAN